MASSIPSKNKTVQRTLNTRHLLHGRRPPTGHRATGESSLLSDATMVRQGEPLAGWMGLIIAHGI
jgi:hypothetical protein